MHTVSQIFGQVEIRNDLDILGKWILYVAKSRLLCCKLRSVLLKWDCLSYS